MISQFPTLISARHARATAYHRKWLNTAPVQTQQMRSSLYTYTARFVPWVTDGAAIGDALALHRARRDYAAILEREIIPGTMANLALLEAYAGAQQQAEKRAAKAASLAPDDPSVLNNLGVIRFLKGDLSGAATIFSDAAAVTDPGPDPVITFNRAKCAAALRDPAAIRLLEKYLELDVYSDWRPEALALLGRSEDVEGRCRRDPPEALPGLSLGVSGDDVTRRYGLPSRVQRWRNVVVWGFDSIGLQVALSPSRGAILIDLRHPELGEIDNIRVGDPTGLARERWGSPAERGEGYLVFWAGEWGIGIECDERDRIVVLSLGCRE